MTIKGDPHQKERDAQQGEMLYRSLFENLLNGFAYCQMLFEDGKPTDFIYLAVNAAFSSQTGLMNVVGKKVSEVIPGIHETDPQILALYGRIAITGQPEHFEMFVEALKMWFSISVYSPAYGYFVAVFDVITERKQTEQKLKEKINDLERFNSLTVDRELRMVELKKEINSILEKVGKKPKYKIAE